MLAVASIASATAGTAAVAGGRVDATSIDPQVQRAAEEAAAGTTQPVDVVVMKASTGRVLAYVSQRGGLAPDDALVGRYPPGSTFKVITAADLLEHGRTPSSPTSCPGSVVIDGRPAVTSFDGAPHPITTLDEAFAQSCNTAFALLADDLPARSFRATARQLGVGVAPRLGRAGYGGTVSVPSSRAEQAAVAADGGTTLVSPLALATMAATVDSGRLRRARLQHGGSTPGARLPGPVLDGLRSMMANVVTSGTAAGQGLPPGTHAKTGTAVFADAPEPRTVYAWLVGYRGDTAFAVLVVGGATGGPSAGPIATQLLSALP